MKQSFLLAYLDAFHHIEGWFDYDAALMFMAYNQILARHGIHGDVLEIGVHHGLSTIAIGSLLNSNARGADARLYAVDLFEDLQDLNVSRSGAGNRKTFERNMRSFFDDIAFVRTLTRASHDLTSNDLGQLSFCHIDGGHSRQETFDDLKLCHQAMIPGGIVALDDYFNVEFPGVCEGAIEFMLKHPGALQPLAVGFHKVLFQKQPVTFDTNLDFLGSFPYIEHRTVQLWDRPTILFTEPLRQYFDLQASRPENFRQLGSVPPRAAIQPEKTILQARAGERLTLPACITNNSSEVFPHGDRVFGLSYHLLSESGQSLRYDNQRAYLKAALAPGETVQCDLVVDVPPDHGKYRLELDLVWEGFMWFKGMGDPTVFVELIVT
jgi:hypothetical protein